MNWTNPRVAGVLVVGIIVGAVLALTLSPEIECPEDYWPHQAQTPGTPPMPPMAVTIVLRDMLDKAVEAYEAEADPINKQVIGDCIVLIWRCAWQDLPGHWGDEEDKKELRDNHAKLVETAAGLAKDGEWDKVKEYMTPNTPISGETIEHPH